MRYKFDLLPMSVIIERLEKRGRRLVVPAYRGMRAYHKVACLRCGHKHVKRLDNLIYRDEPCPRCGYNGALPPAETTPTIPPEELEKVLARLGAIEKELQELRQSQKVQPTPVNSIAAECERLFRKLVSKRGYRYHGGNMNSGEWAAMSVSVMDELLCAVLDDEVAFHFCDTVTTVWNKDKTKPLEKVLFLVLPAVHHQQALNALRLKVVKT